MSRRALLFAAGLAVGLVVGVLVGTTALVPPPPGDGAPTHTAESDRPAEPSGRDAVRTVPRRDSGSAATQALFDAVAAIPVELPFAGTRRITGTVRTTAGDPVPGIRIHTSPDVPDALDRDYWSDEVGLHDRVTRFVRIERWRDAAARGATTGADGTYVLDRLLDADCWVEATSETHEVEHASDATGNVADGDVVDFVAVAQVAVDLSIVFPEGAASDRAALLFTDRLGEKRSFNWTPERTRKHLPPGEYDVKATAGPHDMWRASAAGVVVSAADGTQRLELRLRPRTGLVGRLVFAPGDVRSGANLRLVSMPEGADLSPALFAGRSARVSASGDEEFAFRFLDLAPGAYALAVEGPPHTGLSALWSVVVGDGLVERDFDVPPPNRDDFIELRVFDPDGRPVQDVHVTLTLRSTRWVGASHSDVVRRPDGALWVARLDAESRRHPEARWFLIVLSEKYGRVEVEPDLTSDAATEIHYRPVAQAVVTVEGLSAGGLQSAASVLLRPAGPVGMYRWERGAKPDAAGVAMPPVVQPGDYDVLLVLPHPYLQARAIERRRVLLEAGENRISMMAPDLHGLVVDVGEVGRAWTVTLRSSGSVLARLGSFYTFARPDVAGHVEFERLPAGQYQVSASGEGAPKEPRIFTVPADGPVKF